MANVLDSIPAPLLDRMDQLGDVMKEFAQIALSYLRSHGAKLELPVGDRAGRGIHVHVPAGVVSNTVRTAGASRPGDDR
jgi:ATP-dependent Lon protease